MHTAIIGRACLKALRQGCGPQRNRLVLVPLLTKKQEVPRPRRILDLRTDQATGHSGRVATG